MNDDLLDQFAGQADEQLGKSEASRHKEPNKTIAVKMSDYEQLRKYAFDNNKKIIDVVHELLGRGFKTLED